MVLITHLFDAGKESGEDEGGGGRLQNGKRKVQSRKKTRKIKI